MREPSILDLARVRDRPERGKPTMADKPEREYRDGEFPLEAYAAVYTSIGM
jgi:hypothetical protein